MRYGVIGAGRQGTAAAWDMASFGDAEEIRLIDVDGRAATAAAERINRLAGREVATGQAVDVRDEAALIRSLSGLNAALSAVPYFFNVSVARAAIGAGCHFNDLGGNTDVVREELALSEQAARRGISIVPDCGLAPGMGNTLAAYGLDKFDQPKRARIYCGGLPQHPRPPLGYKQVFSLEGLTNEYTGEAVILRQGERVSVPAFSGLESIDVEGLGKLEAFYTSGGTSTCPWTFEGRLELYQYKTLRYPGHFAMLKPLIDLGFLDKTPVIIEGTAISPRAMAHAVLARWIDFPEDPDLVVLRVEAGGLKDGRWRTFRMEILDRQDPVTGFTAMERTTAFPAAIVTALQARGQIAVGAHPLEVAVPGAPFVAELRRRDIPMKEHWID